MKSNTWTYYIADEDKPSAESEEGFHSLAAFVLCKDREYLLTLNSFINHCVCTIQNSIQKPTIHGLHCNCKW